MEKPIREKVPERLPELKKLIFGEDTTAEPAKVKAASVTLVDSTQISLSSDYEVGATATILDSEGKEIQDSDSSHDAKDCTEFTIAGCVKIEVKPIEEVTSAPVACVAQWAELDLNSPYEALQPDSVKYLFDANLPRRFALWNTTAYIHQLDLGPCWSVQEIWSLALERGLTIITKDSDFSNRVLISQPPPRVIHIRLGNMSMRAFHQHINASWEDVLRLSTGQWLVSLFADRIEAVR